MSTNPSSQFDEGPSGYEDTPAEKAARCRRLAAAVSDPQAAAVLNQMARNYEAAAARNDAGE